MLYFPIQNTVQLNNQEVFGGYIAPDLNLLKIENILVKFVWILIMKLHYRNVIQKYFGMRICLDTRVRFGQNNLFGY